MKLGDPILTIILAVLIVVLAVINKWLKSRR